MTQNDNALKRLYEEFPQLKNHQTFTSAEEFNNWRNTNAPEVPESIWDRYLAPQSSPPTVPSQLNKTSTPHNQFSFTTPAHPAHSSYRPPHDIEEDKTYQNIVKNHVDNWNKQNPNNKFTGKIFVKDNTDKLILNPALNEKITNIAGKTRTTMRTGFGDETVDKYANAEKHRVYKNHAQDPEYQRLQTIKSDVAYDEFVNNHPEKAFAYARKNKELKKALKRRSERLEQQYKEKIKKYKNPADDPAFKKMRMDIDSATDEEYRIELIRQRGKSASPSPWQEQVSNRAQAAPQIDREKIRQKIQQMKYNEFFENYPEKAKAYSKKDPALKKVYENYQLRKKNQEKIAKKQEKKPRGRIFGFLRKKAPQKDPRLIDLEQSINEQINKIDPATRSLIPERITTIREKSYEDFVRKNPTLAKKNPTNHPEIQKAYKKVTTAQKMAKKRGFLYKLRSRLIPPTLLSIPATPTNPSSPLLKSPILSLKEWQTRIRPQNYHQNQDRSQNQQQNSQSFKEQGSKQIRSFFRRNTPSPQSTSMPQPISNDGSRRRIARRPNLSSLGRQTPSIGASTASKAPFSLIRAIGMNPYVLIGILIIFFVVLLILIIYFIITGGDSSNEEFQINVTKTGPSGVPNPESITDEKSNIAYKITVNYSGDADKIIVTDVIPDNAEFISAGQNAMTYDASGAETNDPSLIKKVIWEIIPTGGSNSPGGGTSGAGCTKISNPEGADWAQINSLSNLFLEKVNEVNDALNVCVPVNLIKSLVYLESGGGMLDPNGAGYGGIMQVGTGSWCNHDKYNIFTSEGNVGCGVEHLAHTYQQCNNSWEGAVTAYYAGHCIPNGAADDPAQGGSGKTDHQYTKEIHL